MLARHGGATAGEDSGASKSQLIILAQALEHTRAELAELRGKQLHQTVTQLPKSHFASDAATHNKVCLLFNG